MGVVSKGVFSMHEPERFSLRDRDLLAGMFIPNACGIASIGMVLLSGYF